MSGTRLNIVYKYLPADRIEADPLDSGATEVLWSRRAEAGRDIVVVYNHYSDGGPRLPGSRHLLFNTEPVVVLPEQWTRACWARYDGVLTWNRCLVEEHSFFAYCPVISYDKPWPHPYGIPAEAPDASDWPARKEAFVMIVGGKATLAPWGLYAFRKRLALGCARAAVSMDVFGRPPLRVPNHRGPVEDKLATLRRYKYAVVTENCLHPRWSKGYLTEKLFDVLHAGCVPLYTGCANVEEEFPGAPIVALPPQARAVDLPDLVRGVVPSPDLGAILDRADLRKRFGVGQLYRAALAHAPARPSEWPRDVFQGSSATERTRLGAHLAAMRFYHRRRPA